MRQRLWLLRIGIAVAAAYTAATCAAALAILLWTQDFETLGAGLLVPLFAAPAIGGYALSAAGPRFRRWRRLVYLALVLPVPLYLLWIALCPSEAARMDAADQWALAFLIPLIAAGMAGFLTLEWRQLTNG